MKYLLLIGVFFSVLARGEASSVVGVVTGHSVNIRVAPSLKAEIVGQIKKGRTVNIILTDGEWCAITPPVEVPGWVSAQYVKDGVVTGDRVNLRSGPGVAYARLARLRRGGSLKVLEDRGGWLKVELPPDVRLWVSARYLDLEGPSPLTEDDALKSEDDALKPEDDALKSEDDAAEGIDALDIKDLAYIGEDNALSLPPSPTSALSATSEPIEEEEPPLPAPRGTPFLGREAPAYYPTRFAEVKNYTGVIRELDRPYPRDGRKVTHELLRSGYRQDLICKLTSESIDLERYHLRKVRIWGEELGKEAGGGPLVEVKGVQLLW